MSLRIYNTMSRKKEEFVPLTPGKIGMYVCGVTVYDYCHIGHARVMISFDVIARYLRHQGYEVTFVRNITDVDDKIIDRAKELGISPEDLTGKFIRAFHEDMEALGVEPVSKEPRATYHITEMQQLINSLILKGYAYESNGSVYFRVGKLENPGKLSGRIPEPESDDGDKRDVADFALWKRKEDYGWDSPWGIGRPGWHVECSAMSMKYLGETFDIHGGGLDLVFPHHENEIAQSESYTGKPLANYWMHNGFVTLGDKMSKSTGNYVTIRDALKDYEGEVLRMFVLSSHYRSPVDYTKENLESAKAGLNRLYEALRRAEEFLGEVIPDSEKGYFPSFLEAMDDDFNTPEALSDLFLLASNINRAIDDKNEKVATILSTSLLFHGNLLGLLNESPVEWFKRGVDASEVESLISKREEHRKRKEYIEADAIREELENRGIVLQDGPDKVVWGVR